MGKCLDCFGQRRAALQNASHPSRMEGLEGRVLMAADGPRVLSIVADNRGLVNFSFDRTVEQTTLNTSDILMFTAGKDHKLGTKDDVGQQISGTIYNTAVGANTGLQISANLVPNTQYRVVLVSGGIKGGNSKALDGESVGNGALPSGDGKAGGNLDVIVTPTKKLTARISTSNGPIDVVLYNKYTPKTVANFLNYANSGNWDSTFFDRLVPGFVIQGGEFGINLKRNRTVKTPVFTTTVSTGKKTTSTVPVTVPNEPGISNVAGTIAMAKLPNLPNSATDAFFFNLADNHANLDAQNSGFTVFGAVANSESQAVLTSLGQAGTEGSVDSNTGSLINAVTLAGQASVDVPMINTATYEARNRVLSPTADLVRIFRVAVLEGIIATPGSPVLAVPKAAKAKTVTTASLTTATTGTFGIATAGRRVFADGKPILGDDGTVLT